MAIDSAEKRLALLGAVVPLPNGSFSAIERVGTLSQLYIPAGGADPPSGKAPIFTRRRRLILKTLVPRRRE